MNIQEFGEVERATVTLLVDNKADLIVKSTERVKYFEDEPLLAEHGFSALIRLTNPDLTILWDAGISTIALVENMKRMKIDPASIQKIALSHGHSDHSAALTAVLSAMPLRPGPKDWQQLPGAAEIEGWIEQHRITVVAHPAAFRERWLVKDDGTRFGPFLPPARQEWEAAGARIVLSEEAYQLAAGCWTTGFIPRRSFEVSGRPKRSFYRQGDDFLKDDLEEDQAIAIHVRGKGLVVVSGCAHSGIINTITYAQQISQVNRIHAILGGFHLARSNEDEIQRTIEQLRAFNPELVVPCHCTGFRAMSQIAARMPDQFIEGVVGATLLF